MVIASIFATAGVAQATSYMNYMPKGSYLRPGDVLTARHGLGMVQLRVESGSLVLRLTGPGAKICWLRGSTSYAVYQRDGNFVAINSVGAVVWASNTVGQSGNARITTGGDWYVGSRLIGSC